MRHAFLIGTSLALVLGAGCLLPNDFTKVEGSQGGAGGNGGGGGMGASGGTGGVGAGGEGGAGASDCTPFTPPAAGCDPALLNDADNCCVAGRSCLGGACDQGVCQPRELATSNEETIDAVLVGDDVIYSTGYGRQLRRVAKAGGASELLYEAPSNAVTELTTDGTRVFFTQYDDGRVFSLDPAIGATSLTLVGDNVGHESWFGQIAVDDDNVYWASQDNDGQFPYLWWAPKDGSDTVARAVTENLPSGSSPFGVAVDETHIYWTDVAFGAVYRMALVSLEGGTPELFASGEVEPADIRVNDTTVYWLAGIQLRAQTKGGNTATTLATGGALPWTLELDGDLAYWASEAGNSIYRAPILGGDAEIVATGKSPKGLAVGCDSYVFTTFDIMGPQQVLLVAK